MNKEFKSNHKLRSLLMSLLLLILLSPVGFASKGVDVYLDNKKLDMPRAGVIEEGRTLLPMRAIFESLEADVEWDQLSKTVIATKDDKVLKLPIGSKFAFLNDEKLSLEVPAKVKNGSTLVPLRFITETFGIDTKWDGPSRSVLLNSESPFKKLNIQRVLAGNEVEAEIQGKIEKIRLIGLDTHNLKDDIEREASKNYLDKLLGNAEVAIELDLIERSEDGEILGYLHQNGELVNELIIKNGLARSASSGANIKYKEILDRAELEAKSKELGIWSPEEKHRPKKSEQIKKKKSTVEMPITDGIEEVYITKTGKKYHRSSCRHLRKNKIPISEDLAKSEGYSKCSVCKP